MLDTERMSKVSALILIINLPYSNSFEPDIVRISATDVLKGSLTSFTFVHITVCFVKVNFTASFGSSSGFRAFANSDVGASTA